MGDFPQARVTNAGELIARFQRLPPAMRNGIVAGLRGALLATESRVRTHSGVKWRRGASGLSGRLTSYARAGGKNGIEAAIGFRKTRGFPYELAQEFGAKAKHGKAMAIPVSPIAKRASDRGQGPRDLPGIKLVLLPKTHVLVEARAKGASVLHYVLVKSIPARLRFVETVMSARGDIETGILMGARAGSREAGAA